MESITNAILRFSFYRIISAHVNNIIVNQHKNVALLYQ